MTTSSTQDLSQTVAAVRERPEDLHAWEELETQAEQAEKPEPVSDLYLELLSADLPRSSLERLGERALRFCEQWFADDAPAMQALLHRVFALNPSNDVTFQRLSVSLVQSGQPTKLLDLYARAVEASDSLERQTELLTDAVRAAREMHDDDRAITFMQRLLALRPGDTQLRGQLERLLDKNARYRELIALRDAVARGLPERAAAQAKVQIAELWLDKLRNPRAALDVLRKVLESDPKETLALALLERMLGSEEAALGTRREIMILLRDVFCASGRPLDAARVLRTGAGFSPREECEELLRASANLFTEQGVPAEAFEDLAELFLLRPEDEALAKEVAQKSLELAAHERHVAVLLSAAERTKHKRRAGELMLRAATLAQNPLGDTKLALSLCARVFGEDSEPQLALDAGRALDALLDGQSRHAERVAVLERLALLETDAERKRELLGALAKLARLHGDVERAIATWRTRLALDAQDREALDELITLLATQDDPLPLIDALRTRIKLSQGASAQADLARIAALYAELDKLEAALDTWRELYDHIPGVFATLEVAPLLERAGAHEAARGARILEKLGAAYAEFVNDAERALWFFTRALRSDAQLPAARAGLVRLLEHPGVEGAAAEALAAAYAASAQVEELVALLPHRLAGASEAGERAALLRQTANLEERRLARPEQAFEHLCQALLEEPLAAHGDADLFRLSGQLAAWPALADTLGQAAAKLDPSSARAAQLKLHEAELCETRLANLARAYDAYGAAARSAPLERSLAESVCRVAARLGRFDAAFEQVCVLSGRDERVPEAPLSLIEQEAGEHNTWPELCRAAEAALSAARLMPPVRRALLTRVAGWYERLSELSAAERLLSSAAQAGGAPHVETLRRLAALQRKAPGRPLYDTLLAISDLSEQDLDLLVEATEVAREALGDETLVRAALERLLLRSSGLLASGRTANGSRAAEVCLELAAQELARLLVAAGEARAAVDVLRDAALLPIATSARRTLVESAGKLALEILQDHALGIALYERVLELAPSDTDVLATLAASYNHAGRLDELLSVLRRELTLTRGVARRLELRLEIARVMGEIEARGARSAALRENLNEAPGHAASLNALESVLRERKLHAEIYELLSSQGAQLEALGDTARAAELWMRAARFADEQLHDVERALTAYQKVAALRVDDDAYEALSRIRLARGEASLAIPWLLRRVSRQASGQRAPLRLLLADAYQNAGDVHSAIACLAEGISEAPDAFALRDALLVRYEATGQLEALAALLADSALHAPDSARLLDYGRRAAELYCDKLKQPERALEILSRTIAADSEDRTLRCLYADALTAAGKLPEARQVLGELLAEFGRRRSPERALVHARLAQVAAKADDVGEALAQLEQASSMDRAHTGILRELGALSLRAGELERADRAYRALLMMVRKGPSEDPSEALAAEVLYQLHAIAAAQGQSERASEFLEQAVQAAVQSEAETARLKALLLERGEPALLLRVLEERLALVRDPKTEAEVLTDLAEVLEQGLNRPDDALDASLRALTALPDAEHVHTTTLRLAEATHNLPKYVTVLQNLGERARRKEDAGLVGDLALRAGSILEHKVQDLPAAKAQYQLVDARVPAHVEALTGLARIARKEADLAEERAVLARIVGLTDAPQHAPYKHEARYRLVELDARSADTREAGLMALLALLSDAPDYPRAGAILKAVCADDPRDPRALALFEQIARKSGDPQFLLDFLELHARSPEPALGLLREGAELALSLSQSARAEQLLKRAVEVAEAGEGLTVAPWAAVLLGRLHRDQGQVSLALDWFERALELSDPLEAFARGFELAELAARSPGNEERAVRLYEALREREPSDRRVFAPLLELLEKRGDLTAFLAVVHSTLDVLIDPAERNALRIDAANVLFRHEREQAGAELLEGVLAEDPDHQGATLTLADLYERRGQNEALAELLRRKLEGAVQRHSPSVVPLSLRMGGLLAPTRPDAAVDVYRDALGIVPDSDELLRVTISLLDPEEQADERADLVERYLDGNGRKDHDAQLLALWLVDHRIGQGEEAAVERALALAGSIADGSEALCARRERWYRVREDYPRLAQYLEERAHERAESDHAVALLMEAAEIRLQQLGEPSAAAMLLRKARERAPGDFELLKRAVHASAAAGDLGPAMAEVDAALERAELNTETRVELLLLRAEVASLAGMYDDALTSLDAAYADAPELAGERLVQGLDQARKAAEARANHVRERTLTLRLAELWQHQGAPDRATELYREWLARVGDDREVQRALLQLLYTQQHHAEAITVAESLIARDQPEGFAALAELLYNAAEQLSAPEKARSGLEQLVARSDHAPAIVAWLEQLYERLDDKRALAALLRQRVAQDGPPEQRADELRRIGQLLLDAGDVEAALEPLSAALALKPDDVVTLLFIADAHIAAGRFQQAQDLLEHGMNAQKQRRSPELGLLRQRMARLSDAAGDQEARVEWLNAALDADLNNGDIASETAAVAQETGQYELALKALRAITMLKGDAPMSRAEAFYRQAQIVALKGEPRRAVLWAKKAKAEDANLPGVDALLAELGDS